jgi:hypothetical protein
LTKYKATLDRKWAAWNHSLKFGRSIVLPKTEFPVYPLIDLRLGASSHNDLFNRGVIQAALLEE